MTASRLAMTFCRLAGNITGRVPSSYRLSTHAPLGRHGSRVASSPGDQGMEAGPRLSPRASQTTDTVLVVTPKYFKMNPSTALDNKYQTLPARLRGASDEEIGALAMEEFQGMVTLLKEHGVRVLETEPLEEHRDCSDAVFPNNWVSFHEGKIVLYPMKAENRRQERRSDVVKRLSGELRAEVVDYTGWEAEGKFLEGTGSMVLDRVNRVCYACVSQRTHPDPLTRFCRDFDYKAVTFEASQASPDVASGSASVSGGGQQLWPVYHTNVICSVGDTFALLCAESIRDEIQRRAVVDALEATGKELVQIRESQVFQFAGNVLQLHSTAGKRLLVMSTAAFQSFDEQQLRALERHVHRILHTPLPTIEALGGGGARCMLAEVFSH